MLAVEFRPATARDEPFLRPMLWIAAQWQQPEPPPADAALPPELARYVDGFGRPGAAARSRHAGERRSRRRGAGC